MAKFNAEVNGNFKFELELKNKELLVNGKNQKLDIVKKSFGEMHILRNGISYTAELIKNSAETKEMTLLVNGNKYTVALRDEYDLLLDSLGLSAQMNAVDMDLKAPMPGLVLDVKVKDGDSVKKGDALLILEAMKMENVLKATADATIQSVKAKKGNTVDKNEILIQFES